MDRRMKRSTLITGTVGLLVSIPILLLLTKCTVVHFENNAGAEHLLLKLEHIPLPPNSFLRKQGWEVGGGYFSATGDASDFLAYRVFVVNLRPQQVSQYFDPYIKQPNFDAGVFPLDQAPRGAYLPIEHISAHVPTSDRSQAYVLYLLDRGVEDGFWDIRGW